VTWLGLGIGLGHRVTQGLVGGAPVIGHERIVRGTACASREVRGESCA